jgi:hypothetical protein
MRKVPALLPDGHLRHQHCLMMAAHVIVGESLTLTEGARAETAVGACVVQLLCMTAIGREAARACTPVPEQSQMPGISSPMRRDQAGA